MEQNGAKLNTECTVSIIMPVYKVEAYVGKAIESIQAQRYADGSAFTDWELIAVDDGSPDRSGEICECYAASDPRIRVLHQENGGAPKARNSAIPLSRGKYLFFMDSDDHCDPTMLADLTALAEETDAQLVIAGFYIDTYYKLGTDAAGKIDEKESRYLTSDYIPESGVYRTKEAFRRDAYRLFDKNMLYPPWNKLYLRSYIVKNELFFPQTFWDDFPFVLSVIRNVERVAVTPKQYYHFLRARSESETAKYVPQMYEKREEEHQWMVELYQYWGLWEICGTAEPDVDRRTDASAGLHADSKTEPGAALETARIIRDSREMISRRYVDRLIGCFENLSSPNCKLSRAEKREQAEKLLASKSLDGALSEAKPRSLYARLMYLPLRWKSRFWMMREAEVITWVKQHNMRLFAKLKAGR